MGVSSTYLGGTAFDSAHSIVLDGETNILLTGQTASLNVPGADPSGRGGSRDAFVTKINATGTSIVYSTYLGGSSDDTGNGIAVDAVGRAYVTGTMSSGDFPSQDRAFGGGKDAFVSVFTPTGDFVYSSYVGGQGDDEGNAIAVNPAFSGLVFVTGSTASDDFPTTRTAFRTNKRALKDAFLSELDILALPAEFLYSTYFGGNDDDEGRAIAAVLVNQAQPPRVFVAGKTESSNLPTHAGVMCCTIFGCNFCFAAFQQGYQGGSSDGFVASFVTVNRGNDSLLYSTYLGGSRSDAANAIAVDTAGRAHVTGVTGSAAFPQKGIIRPIKGATDAFVTKLDPVATNILYSTLLGGRDSEVGRGIALDSSGRAWVTDRPVPGNCWIWTPEPLSRPDCSRKMPASRTRIK